MEDEGRPILIDGATIGSFHSYTHAFRERLLKEIIRHLKPVMHKRDGRNILITGPTGTGKTTIAKWILSEHLQHGLYRTN